MPRATSFVFLNVVLDQWEIRDRSASEKQVAKRNDDSRRGQSCL